MREDFLQYIWQYQLFATDHVHALLLTDGRPLQVVKTGVRNSNQGPDFLQSSVRIDDVQWNGSIEVHIQSSDWYGHHHEGDPHYQNVILHVVWEYNKGIYYADGTEVPTLELKQLVSPKAFSFYEQMRSSAQSVVCASQLPSVSLLKVHHMLERVLVERLERKSLLYEEWWLENKKDWAQTTFEIIAYCLGLKINALTMRQLAHAIPYHVLLKLADHPQKVESVVMGMAGFLDQQPDHPLYKEFAYLRHKHVLQSPITPTGWKYSRLRPASFPEVRVSQLIALVLHSQSLYSRLKEAEDIATLRAIFTAHFSSSYFGEQSATIGRSTLDILILNAVLPLWYMLYQKQGDAMYLNRIFHVLDQLSPERNHKTERLKDHFPLNTAFDTQAVMELYDAYCVPKRCLECVIANAILA